MVGVWAPDAASAEGRVKLFPKKHHGQILFKVSRVHLIVFAASCHLRPCHRRLKVQPSGFPHVLNTLGAVISGRHRRYIVDRLPVEQYITRLLEVKGSFSLKAEEAAAAEKQK